MTQLRYSQRKIKKYFVLQEELYTLDFTSSKTKLLFTVNNTVNTVNKSLLLKPRFMFLVIFGKRKTCSKQFSYFLPLLFVFTKLTKVLVFIEIKVKLAKVRNNLL